LCCLFMCKSAHDLFKFYAIMMEAQLKKMIVGVSDAPVFEVKQHART